MSQKGKAHRLRISLMTTPFLFQASLPENKAILEDRYRRQLLYAWQHSQEVGDILLAQTAWRGLMRYRHWAGWNVTTTIRNFLKAHFPTAERSIARVLGKGGSPIT